MISNLQQSISIAALLVVSWLLTTGGTTAYAKSNRHPLDQIEVQLIHHDNILKRHDDSMVILRCSKSSEDIDPQLSVLSRCPIYQVIQQSTTKTSKLEIVLGQFEKIYFADFLAHLAAAYNPNYNVSPLEICTIYGFLGGQFYGGLPGAIAGAALGFTLDLAKLPVALIYTLSSYTHRQLQQQRLLVRLNDLQFNRPYRPTRILARKHYMQMVNALKEYLDHFRLDSPTNES